MCGIVGYTGTRDAAEVLLKGLSNLEYRGYDSAGISIVQNNQIKTIKSKGRLADLQSKLNTYGCPHGNLGIGHTRWATHGEPSDINSHPHTTQRLALVHNGIIENYLKLKDFLTGKGYEFETQTDTETASKLIDYYYNGDPYQAIRKSLGDIEGSYALGVVFADFPDKIFAARLDSPLIVGLGENENYIASDVPAILEYTREYYLIEEGEIVELTSSEVIVRDSSGSIVEKEKHTASWDIEQAQKGGYEHFMIKEIHEQPKALSDTVHPIMSDGLVDFSADGLDKDFFARYDKIFIVACGTAWHAGMLGKSVIEKLARVPVEVDLASEFRYRDPILPAGTLMMVISQSGETADTLAALRLAKNKGVDTLAVVNVTGSSIAREADYVIHTHAGLEIAVASTKAFSVQIAVMYLIAINMALGKKAIDTAKARLLCSNLTSTIKLTREALKYSDTLKEIAKDFVETQSIFYLGRGIDYSLALEGSLKLKEISYILSEAYAAGELKHGTISLITDAVPVIGLLTQEDILPKIISNIKETRSRGAKVFVITCEGFEVEASLYDYIIRLPKTESIFMSVLAVIILQLFAYHVSVARGCDVDKPRNLAKSVTVE